MRVSRIVASAAAQYVKELQKGKKTSWAREVETEKNHLYKVNPIEGINYPRARKVEFAEQGNQVDIYV